jgi:glutathione S-transferase
MALVLYDHPLSPYTQKVKIALMEKGVEFEAPMPDGIGTGASIEDFMAASPRGEVPALVEGDDVRLFDSTIMLEYIEDRWPQPPLLPTDPLERARVRMIEDAIDTHVEAIGWGLAEVRFFGRGSSEVAEKIEESAAEQVAGWYRWLTTQLGDRTWFNGDSFGWGDLAVVPFLNSIVRFGFEPEGKLRDWHVRVNERPSVTACREAAEEVAFDGPHSDLEGLKAAVASGAFKREYRDHRLEWMIKSGGISVVLDGLEKNNIRFTDVFS